VKFQTAHLHATSAPWNSSHTSVCREAIERTKVIHRSVKIVCKCAWGAIFQQLCCSPTSLMNPIYRKVGAVGFSRFGLPVLLITHSQMQLRFMAVVKNVSLQALHALCPSPYVGVDGIFSRNRCAERAVCETVTWVIVFHAICSL
jgi:hypothetical protein